MISLHYAHVRDQILLRRPPRHEYKSIFLCFMHFKHNRKKIVSIFNLKNHEYSKNYGKFVFSLLWMPD